MTLKSVAIRAVIVAAVSIAAAFAEEHGVAVPPELREHITEAAFAAALLAVSLKRKRKPIPADTPSEQGEQATAKGEAATPEA